MASVSIMKTRKASMTHKLIFKFSLKNNLKRYARIDRERQFVIEFITV